MAKLMFLRPMQIDKSEVLINQVYCISKSRNRLRIWTYVQRKVVKARGFLPRGWTFEWVRQDKFKGGGA